MVFHVLRHSSLVQAKIVSLLESKCLTIFLLQKGAKKERSNVLLLLVLFYSFRIFIFRAASVSTSITTYRTPMVTKIAGQPN